MSAGEYHRWAVEKSQDSAHGTSHDYTLGSPHLRHAVLKKRLDDQIASAIGEIVQRHGECAVLEIGAGHGFFTDTVLAAGGTTTVTEMSKASFEYLTERFRNVPAVRVVYDPDGNAPFKDGAQYDVILLISVIHHIPDYVDVITRLCDFALRPGGTVITYQDPLWYPRQKRSARMLSWGLYFAWRVTQGELRRGLRTRWRRLRGVYSESEASDLVEYHVVRQGVDEVELKEIFDARFREVAIDRYFSTQAPRFQALGERRLPPNTFGFVARGRQEHTNTNWTDSNAGQG